MKRKLPIGLQTFREIREEGHYYVDKTMYALSLLEGGGCHFMLSRPRRFGKSLFVDMLKELFEGNEPLFRGLDIHERWDWSVRHPVVRLVFDSGDYNDPDWLAEDLSSQLRPVEESAGIECDYASASIRFRHLVSELHERTGERVILLVDEYNKPILDALGKPEVARANRDFLSRIYEVTKSGDAHIRFSFLTGAAPFPKPGIFSGLNNFLDVSLERRYSAICGYTERDLDSVFAPELDGLDRGEIRRWYNGYNWLGDENVYNPFDILSLFDRREFGDYWCETGSPSFLIDTLLDRGVRTLDLDGMIAGESRLSTFDVDNMPTEAFLFQSGYLTIADKDEDDYATICRLGYPNQEVRRNLNEHLLNALLPESARRLAWNGSLHELFAANDFEGVEALFRAIFADIPDQWQAEKDLGERFCASVFYSCLAAQGFDVTGESKVYPEWAGMALRLDGRAHVFEFRTAGKERQENAMARDFAVKHGASHLIGVEFSLKDRNIAAFEVERL